MVDGVEDKPPEQVRGRPFPRGRSGNPAGGRFGSRNRATTAAMELLTDEAEALTRKAVEAALAGDPWTFGSRACPVGAMRLCLERICRATARSRPDLDQIKQVEKGCGTGVGRSPGSVGQSRRRAARLPLRAGDVARAMGAVTAALADGLITPAEGQAIARMVTTFVETIEVSDFDRRLQLLEADQSEPPSSPLGVWPHSRHTT